VVLDAAGERPYRLRRLGGQVFDREGKLDVWHMGIRRGREEGAVDGAQDGESFLAIDIIDHVRLKDVEL